MRSAFDPAGIDRRNAGAGSRTHSDRRMGGGGRTGRIDQLRRRRGQVGAAHLIATWAGFFMRRMIPATGVQRAVRAQGRRFPFPSRRVVMVVVTTMCVSVFVSGRFGSCAHLLMMFTTAAVRVGMMPAATQHAVRDDRRGGYQVDELGEHTPFR